MKSLFTTLTILCTGAFCAYAQTPDYTYQTDGLGTKVNWSSVWKNVFKGTDFSSSNKVTDFEAEGVPTMPDSNKAYVYLNWDTKSITLDVGEATIGRLAANSSMGVTQGSDVFFYGYNSILNIDTSAVHTTSGQNNTGNDSDKYTYAIYFDVGNEHSQNKFNNNPEAKITFAGGTYNLTGSATYANAIKMGGWGLPASGNADDNKNSSLTSPLAKTMTFDADTILNSSTDLYVIGNTNYFTLNGVANLGAIVTYNFDGEVNVFDSATSTYKNMYFTGSSAITNGSSNVNIGGTFNAGQTSLDQGVSMTIKNGGTYNAHGSQFKLSSWGSAQKTILKVEQGGNLTAGQIWIGDRSDVEIFGNIKTTNSDLYFYQSTQKERTSTLTFKAGSTADIKTKIVIAQSHMIVESGVAKGALLLRSGAISLDNNNTELTLNASNPFRTETGDQSKLVLYAVRGTSTININANQNFSHINFEKNLIDGHVSKVANNTVILNIAESVDFVGLATIGSGTLIDNGELYLDNGLIINGFRNDLIHIDDWNESDDINRIVITGYENLQVVADTTGIGGYWLYATEVPEPATLAAIFGALALGTAIYRRRK